MQIEHRRPLERSTQGVCRRCESRAHKSRDGSRQQSQRFYAGPGDGIFQPFPHSRPLCKRPERGSQRLRSRRCAGALAPSRIAVRGARLLQGMLDSRFAITQTAGPAEEPRRGDWRGHRQLRLSVQPFGRAGTGRPRRAALCLDRAGHGANGRLGYAYALRQTVVREAGTLLLGGCDRISPALAGGMGSAIAVGVCGAGRGDCDWMARMEALWQWRRLVARSVASGASNFLHQRRQHLLCAGGNSRHAIRHRYHAGDGVRCECIAPQRRSVWPRRFDEPGTRAQRTEGSDYARIIRCVPWIGSSRQGSGRCNTRRRRNRNLVACHAKVARGFSARASDWNRHFRTGRAAVVCDLRATQSGFPSCLRLSAQFRALPDASVSAQAAFLVFRTDHVCWRCCPGPFS